MAWVACDKDGKEHIFKFQPIRRIEGFFGLSQKDTGYMFIPKGSIKKLIGRELKWSDEPVELI